jgi:hypothetical protein
MRAQHFAAEVARLGEPEPYGPGQPRVVSASPITLRWHGEADPDADRAWLV